MSKNSFRTAISMINSGERFPVMSLVRQDPELAAVISKLIPGREAPIYGSDGNRQAPMPDTARLRSQSQHIAQIRNDAETVMSILPDQELAAQILISSILAPKDMTTTELTYSHAEGILPADVTAALITRVKQHFEQDYKIEPLLPRMLRGILFDSGSFPIAVIPENSLDEVINSQSRITMEGLAGDLNRDGSIKSLGVLGPTVKNRPTQERQVPGLAMETLNDFRVEPVTDSLVRFELAFTTPVADTYVSVTDNPNLLKIPQINQKIREERIRGAIGSRALESLSNKLSDREMSHLLYKDHSFAYKPINALKTQEQLNRRSVGNPLVLHLPSEAVIPVYVPGNPQSHIGYFVLIDSDGNPVTKASNQDYYQELQSRLNQNGSFPSAMLAKVKNSMNGFDLTNRDHLDYSVRAYSQMVEQDLLARLRNGIYGSGVAIANKDDVYRIMLGRALAKQHTQLLFLPIELMTYFAFRYNDQGVGKSLLEDMQILNSLRSMLLFSNVMASLRNSIGRTEVKLKLDEHDPDPKKTIEMAMHEIVRSRQQYFPLGMNSPTDLVDWLQRSGMEFTFEGHPGLPDVAVDFGEKNSNYPKPDSELEDSLRKRSIMAIGLSPEMVDNSFNAEFATTALQNNLLLSKRVTQIQEQFTPQLSDHMRKEMMNSETLINDLREILNVNFDKLKVEKDQQRQAIQTAQANAASRAEQGDTNIAKIDDKLAKEHVINQFLTEFLMSFEVALPKPNSVTLENQLTALETYTKALDATLDSWISSSFFNSDTAGEVSSQVDTIKEMLKAYFIRQWLSENGVMTELSTLTATDSEGKPMLDLYAAQKTHIEALTKSLTALMVGLQEVKNASDTVLENKVGEMEGGSAPASDSTDDTGGADDGFGTDDFGTDSSDLDLSDMGATPAADTGATDTGTEESSSVEEPEAAPTDEPNKDGTQGSTE